MDVTIIPDVWMAGGGIKGGVAYGETDEFSYNIVREKANVVKAVLA